MTHLVKRGGGCEFAISRGPPSSLARRGNVVPSELNKEARCVTHDQAGWGYTRRPTWCLQGTRGPGVASGGEERDVYYRVGRRPGKIAKKGEKLREAKATTLRRVRPARSCAMGARYELRETGLHRSKSHARHVPVRVLHPLLPVLYSA